MQTITLPFELEQVVKIRAEQQGTTPELVAIDGLRELFLTAGKPNPKETAQTMADYLGDFIGCFDSRDLVSGGANLSDNTGKQFKELMLKKYLEGSL